MRPTFERLALVGLVNVKHCTQCADRGLGVSSYRTVPPPIRYRISASFDRGMHGAGFITGFAHTHLRERAEREATHPTKPIPACKHP
jgi:hypothetical protein